MDLRESFISSILTLTALNATVIISFLVGHKLKAPALNGVNATEQSVIAAADIHFLVPAADNSILSMHGFGCCEVLFSGRGGKVESDWLESEMMSSSLTYYQPTPSPLCFAFG